MRICRQVTTKRGKLNETATLSSLGYTVDRSLLDVAPSTIRRMLEYKAPWHGNRVVAVDPAYTSQAPQILQDP